MKYYYVYILQSEIYPNRYYTGFTEDLKARLAAHNAGQDPHTSKYKPWRIKTSIAFTDRQKALDFETYLKSPSGRAFAKKDSDYPIGLLLGSLLKIIFKFVGLESEVR